MSTVRTGVGFGQPAAAGHVEQLETAGSGADAERQRRDGRQGEKRLTQDPSNPIPDILAEPEQPLGPFGAALSLPGSGSRGSCRPLDIPFGSARRAGFPGVMPCSRYPRSRLVEVEFDLILGRRRPGRGRQSGGQRRQRGSGFMFRRRAQPGRHRSLRRGENQRRRTGTRCRLVAAGAAWRGQ